MDNIYYVYVLVDPRTNEPFYVGKGHDDRHKHHRYTRNKFPNRPVSKRIHEILNKGYKDVIYQFPKIFLSEEEAFGAERDLIQSIGRADQGTGPLLNATNGGDGWSNGRTWTKDYRSRRLAYNHDNPRGHSVNQYTLCGELIKTYPSANHAARELSLGSGAAGRIRCCCCGSSNSASGFMWAYSDTPTPVYLKQNRKPVAQYTKDGILVSNYVSISEASNQTGINAGDIATMCRGQRYKSVGGYVWRYY